jgi:hypothetical protein
MFGWRRSGAGAVAWALLCSACAASLLACGLILGLDSGVPLTDASADAVGTPADASSSSSEPGIDAPAGDEPPPLTDKMPTLTPNGVDASTPIHGDACTPDPSWCDSRCGTGPDNCGEARTCPTDCAQGYVCGNSQTCQCQREANWCTGRCGMTTDNCGASIDCGVCDGGECQAEPVKQACGTRQCGQAVNNCGQLVNCGLLNTSLCLGLCLADGGCCTPNNNAACSNQCSTTVTNNCGQSVKCPNSCGNNRICYQNACCTPNDPCNGACGVTKENSCGETVSCVCSSSEECSTTGTCCKATGCGGNCLDNCGLSNGSCCVDAGSGSGTEGGAPNAG